MDDAHVPGAHAPGAQLPGAQLPGAQLPGAQLPAAPALGAPAPQVQGTGHVREEPGGGWLPCRATVTGLGLELAAQPVTGPTVQLLLAHGAYSVRGTNPSGPGRSTVTVELADGRALSADLPDELVAHLVGLGPAAVGADVTVLRTQPVAVVPPAPAPGPPTAPTVPVPVAPGPSPLAGTAPGAGPVITVRPRTPTSTKVAWGGLVVALFAIAGLVTALVLQVDRATEAEDRADAVDTQLAATRAELETRTQELAGARAEIESLTGRVSELGNEKAQVQDERNAAQEVARLGLDATEKLRSCTAGVLQALEYAAAESWLLATAELEIATPACNAGAAALEALQAAVG